MVGAGIVGVALAREITSRFPDAEVTVFDKAERVAAHQSGHTSGVVDPALAAQPGSPEAKLAHRGVELLVPFVSERGIPYRECGQLLVAQNTDEADRLEEILARAEANSIPGVRLLDRKEMREIEPNARGVLALYAPHTAVTDFTALTEALASDVSAAGGTFRLSTEVTGFDVMSNEVRLRMRAAAPESHDGVEHDGDAGGDDAAGSSDSDRRDRIFKPRGLNAAISTIRCTRLRERIAATTPPDRSLTSAMSCAAASALRTGSNRSKTRSATSATDSPIPLRGENARARGMSVQPARASVQPRGVNDVRPSVSARPASMSVRTRPRARRCSTSSSSAPASKPTVWRWPPASTTTLASSRSPATTTPSTTAPGRRGGPGHHRRGP